MTPKSHPHAPLAGKYKPLWILLVALASLLASPASAQDEPVTHRDRGLKLMGEGYTFQSTTALKQAASELEQAVNQNPVDPELRKQLGFLYYDGLKNYRAASRHREALVILDPLDEENVWSLAEALQKDGQHARAAYYYWRYNQYYPGNVWATYRQGRESRKAWLYDEGEAAYYGPGIYQGAFAAAPKNENLVFARAWTHSWWGNRKKADIIADQLLAVDYSDADALALKGDNAAVDRDFDRAMHFYGQSLDVDPDNNFAKAGLDAIERARRAKVNVDYYNFLDTEKFGQSSIFTSALVPVDDHLDIIPQLNYRWFTQDKRANSERLEGAVDAAYHFNRYFTFAGGVTQFVTDGKNPVVGYNLSGYISPTTVTHFNIYYKHHVPMSTSITSVAGRYTENIIGGSGLFEITPDVWVYAEAGEADISNSNDNWRVWGIPQLGIRLWEYPDIVLKNQLEFIRYDHTDPDYPSPENYDTYRILLEADVPVCIGFGWWTRYELPILLKSGSVGSCITTGPYFRPTKTTLLSINYIYCYYPDDSYNWSGQGFKASFTVEF